jgi:GNAT superfamily N-acetyltransferase
MQQPVTLTIDGQPVSIRPVQASEIIDLRHRVLRAGLPRSQAMFPGDDLPTSGHFAAYVTANPAPLGCATFHLGTWEGAPAFQLRGMATDPAWVGKGIGTAVLRFAMDSIQSASPIRLFWCNARLIALPFYKKLGWQIASEQFEIPTAGPHFRMVLSLKSDLADDRPSANADQ